MPELITCGQNNCVHHVRFGSCAAVRVSVACKGRGKHKTFCDSFVPKPPPKIKKKQRDLTLWERYFGEADRLLALETAAPIAEGESYVVKCTVGRCRYCEDGACTREEPIFFSPQQGRLRPFCTGYQRRQKQAHTT